jgi:putative transcriptional regulator
MKNSTIHHHPSDEQLTEFSAGSLVMSRALCISAHLDHCHDCQQRLARLQRLGSAQLETLAPQSVSNTLKQSIMAKIHEISPPQEKSPIKKETTSDVPRCLQKWVPDSLDDLSWTKISPSISISELCTEGNGAKAALVKVKAGGNMAHHSHTGEEVTVILKGSYSDEDGIYRKGDYVFRDPGHKHKPIATKDQDCVCLIVLDAPIQFTGWIQRLLNPFLRLNHKQPLLVG